jgi:hypothetical protein
VKKNLFVILLTAILVILNACTAPSTTAVVYPTQTPASTPTPLPPTPALDGLLLSGETLSTTTDGIPRYALTRTGWEPIPPEDLSDELANIEGWNYVQGKQGGLHIVDLEGDPIWIEIRGVWIQLPPELPEGWQVIDNGQNIVDANSKPLYILSTEEEGKEGEWIKDYPRVDIMHYTENQLDLEDFAPGGTVDLFFERVRPEILASIDWDRIDADKVEWATVSGAFTPRPDFDTGKPRYTNKASNAFIRDFNAFGELVVGENHYLFMPVILFDTDDQTIHFVKAAYPLQKDGVSYDKETIRRRIDTWLNEMNVTPLSFNAKPNNDAEQDDPLFLPNLVPETRELMIEVTRPIVVGNRDGDLISNMDQLKDIIWMSLIFYLPDGNWFR